MIHCSPFWLKKGRKVVSMPSSWNIFTPAEVPKYMATFPFRNRSITSSYIRFRSSAVRWVS